MAVSQKKIEANAANAKKSTGPRTVEGKERSRLNAFKHGLTGEGIALPDEDARAIDARFDKLRRQMKPRTELGETILSRVCLMLLRMDRSAEHEAAMLRIAAQTAEIHHVETRLGEMDQLLAEITETPWTNSRRLREYPEGLDRMLTRFGGIREALLETEWERYDHFHRLQLNALMGHHEDDIPSSRVKGLNHAMSGSVWYLDRGETEGWDQDRRKAWARSELISILDAEVIQLGRQRKEVESKAVILTAPEAIKAAKFDASKEAILARKYEAASERSFHRLLREYREVEAAYDGVEEDATPEFDTVSTTVGSFSPGLDSRPDDVPPGRGNRPDPVSKPVESPADLDPSPRITP